jgi:hypothetical protein
VEDQSPVFISPLFAPCYARTNCSIKLKSGKVEEDWGALTLTVEKAERMQS